MKLTRTDVILITIVFFIFISSLINQYPIIAQSTKITDWVSSFANCFMALFAFFGFKIANDWRNEITRDDGYKLSLKIKDEILYDLRCLSHTFSTIEIAWALASDGVNHPNDILPGVNKSRRVLAIDNLKCIDEFIDRMKRHTRDLEVSLRHLQSIGWEVIPSKKVKIDEIVEMVENSFPIVFPILYAEQEVLGLSVKIADQSGNIFPNGYNHLSKDELLKIMKEQGAIFMEHMSSYSKKCSNLLDDDYYVLNFFRPVHRN
ncbi:hypothetical protein [Pectobacterium cacticida]|uniref:hypothetical protein n=1 Tax=Pectobacterium cacticida TaxID=69221 RepID=UPI002FEEF659